MAIIAQMIVAFLYQLACSRVDCLVQRRLRKLNSSFFISLIEKGRMTLLSLRPFDGII